MNDAVLLSTRQFPAPPAVVSERRPTPGQWGVIAFLFSEVAFFSTLIVAYLIFYGRDHQPGGLGGPTPAGVLSLGLAIGTTLCLLISSLTAHLAERALHKGRVSTFIPFWIGTIALGIAFLTGTAYEWNGLINREHLTISRNLFGTTFYTLVGFHAFHVTTGVIAMLIVLGLAGRGRITQKNQESVQLISWFWHFVDAVWIVVFSVVYVMPHVT